MTTTARDRIITLPTGSKFHFASAPSRRFFVEDKGELVTEGTSRWTIRDNGVFRTWGADDLVIDELGPELEFTEYDASMLPMFKRLADEAASRGYCEEYDRIAAVVGAPSRAEIRRLTAPPTFTWKVKVPILTHITLEVEAESEEEALRKSNSTHYRSAFEEQRSRAPFGDNGYYTSPDKKFDARITAERA